MNTTTTFTLNNSDDIIDVRDIIARYEELETLTNSESISLTKDGELISRDEMSDDELREAGDDDSIEFLLIRELLSDLEGLGSDEQWRGDWYPIMLIRETYFVEYAQELAKDCGMVNADAKWPNNHINWEAAARELEYDYSTVTITVDGFAVDYLTR